MVLRLLSSLGIFCAILFASLQASAQPFWAGGSFNEQPHPGSFVLIDTGERMGSWRVTGESGNAAWTSGGYTHNGFNFFAQNPATKTTDIWVNLAGLSQSKTGILHHPVPTTVGTKYTFSFYIGNLYDPGGIYGTTSSVAVYANKVLLGTYTNSMGAGTHDETWQQFTVTFTADAPYTTIALINADPPGDLNCGVDTSNLIVARNQGDAEGAVP